MSLSLKIVFRGLSANDALEALARRRVRDLVQRHADVVGCHLLVDEALETWGDAGRYHARVQIGLISGRVVGAGGDFADAHPTAFSAVIAAFDAADDALAERQAAASGVRLRVSARYPAAS